MNMDGKEHRDHISLGVCGCGCGVHGYGSPMARMLMFTDTHGCGLCIHAYGSPMGHGHGCSGIVGIPGLGCPITSVLGVDSPWEWKDVETS